MATRKPTYNASDIQVLEGLQPVRKRPAMYIRDPVEVTLHKDGPSATITDDGRGIPVDVMPKYKKPAIEVILTTLHSGGKFEKGNYIHSGGLHGVGSSVVNALSSSLIARVKRGGKHHVQSYSKGLAISKLKAEGNAR